MSTVNSSSTMTPDRFIALTLWVCAAVAVGLGLSYDGLLTSLVVGIPVATAFTLLAVSQPGALLTRIAAGIATMVMIALHIHVGNGAPELHFGVFVLMSFLLAYRDWKPIIAAAVTIALHHLVFDYLQAAGTGVMCFTETGFARVLAHAAYVVAEAGVLSLMAVKMARDDAQGRDVQAITARIMRGERLDLGGAAHISVESTLGAELQNVLRRVHDVIAQVASAAGTLSAATREISQGNQTLSQRTEQQARSLQSTAASMEQMTVSVRQSADSAKQANQLAATASEVAERGGTMVGKVINTMQTISGQSRRIAEITGVIDGIAFQTNILALNAAVESARAGEHGRGFAVVASEVRSLAQRSAQAAREITTLINESVTNVETGAKLVDEAGQTMSEIVAQVKRVTDLIAEITSATLEQSSGIGQVNQSVTHLDQMTQQNAALVQESAAAAESLQTQAGQMAVAVSLFSVDAVGASAR
jgi:methyl-accepting chemotaxis protein